MAERKRSPRRLRPVEKRQAGRALVGQPLGQRPAGLAHRMLGHEPPACWARRSTSTAAGSTWSFPHHENEIAQSECCHGKPQAKYWMHNGLMQASNEVGKVGGRATRETADGDQAAKKPARSANRKAPAPLRELLKEHAGRDDPLLPAVDPLSPPDRFQRRAHCAKSHTASSSSIASSSASSASPGQSFYALDAAATAPRAGDCRRQRSAAGSRSPPSRQHFLEAMDDDFNTGGATADLFELVAHAQQVVDEQQLEDPARPTPAQLASLRQGATVLRELAATLGLFRKPVEEPAAGGDDELVVKLMEAAHRAAGRSPQEEGLCHLRPDSQSSGRDRHHARRSPRRHRVDRAPK